MIHYFLSGDLNYDYRDSWVKYAGHMEHKHWHADNLPVQEYPEIVKYIEEKKWSIVSDFVRRWAIYTYGGIYLDFDVELIKPIDHLLDEYAFICIEGPPAFANAAVTGGKAGNKHHKGMLTGYFNILTKGSPQPNEVGPGEATEYLKMIGGTPDIDKITEIDGLKTLPREYFYPFNYNETYTPECITENTLGIHWWKKGW